MLAMEGGGSYLTGVQPMNQSPRTSLFLRKLEQVNSLGGSEMEGASYFGVRPMDQTPRTIPMLRKLDQINSVEMSTRSHKKMKVDNEDKEDSSVPWFTDSQFESKYKTKKIPNVIDYSDPFSIPQLMEELNRSIYGCVAKDIQDLRARKIQSLHAKFESYPSIPSYRLDLSSDPSNFRLDTDLLNARSTKASQLDDKQSSQLASQKVVELDDDCIVVDPPVVVNSKSVSVSSTEKTQEPGRQSILPVTGVGHMKISDVQNNIKSDSNGVLIIDSDEEDNGTQTIQSVTIRSAAPEATPLVSCKYQEVVLKKPTDRNTVKELQITGLDANLQAFYKYQELFLKKPTCGNTIKEREDKNARESAQDEQKNVVVEKEKKREKGVYVGVQGDSASHNSNLQSKQEDGLEDMWREMALALEFSKPKDGTEDGPAVSSGGEEGDECDHSFVLKDDLGYVCRVCGVIDKSIETIFDYQWSKGPKTTRTYMSEARNTRDREHDVTSFAETSQQDLAVTEVSIHPRHKKQMKPHQLEGFDFLVRNLVADEPGGCILAHAPGSGKTFMIISFLQSFLAKYPNARPLIVLPKGILATWKREFPRWQIEDFPLYDFYTTKAEKRSDQLEILKQWMEHKGILFLGYKQFSNIVCSSENSKTAAACHDLLLSVPTILILDEGHTPRNEDTNVVNALAQVKTPRKVVLSGTLFQNHVREVFNILNLVRPKFLKLDTSKAIKRRIMSRVQISGGRRQLKANGGDPLFYDLVEETLQHDEDFKRKVTVIRDLREMTKNVLHYYKGDFLDELPGILDLTVFLNLSPKQKYHVEKLKKMEKFKRHSIGTAVYIHPLLKEFSETALVRDKGCHFDEDKMENLLNKMDIRDGVKAKFFLNILALCESSGEKVLVFSQYLLPLKFLEKLVVKTKGWSVGKEIFIISGDTSPEQRELSMERFNNTSEAKVFFGSIKACGEGISLVGASRVLLLDVHLNPSVSRQAIGRAFRPGQERKVYIYRLVAAESPEEENHNTCFRKELISKMWFEWSEYSGDKNFEMETVDSKDTDDMFWESPLLGEDVKVLYKR